MPRFVRYEDALAYARSQARLNAAALVAGLDASPHAAEVLIRQLEAAGVIGPAGPDGLHPAQQERQRRWQGMGSGGHGGGGPGDPQLAAEVARLRAEAATATRRAAQVEAQLAATIAAEARIAALRRVLARELHPDIAAPTGDAALQAAYAEVFKRVWPRIEQALAGLDAAEPDAEPAAGAPKESG